MKRLVLLALVAACTGDLDPEWQLDHDRIIAVRATPPAIASGETSELDGLLAMKGGPVAESAPELAAVVSPQSLAGALAQDGGRWIVTAPTEEQLAAARGELGLDAGEPVPLQIGVSYRAQTLAALKIVWLGKQGANPELRTIMMNEQPAPESEIVVRKEVDVPLSIEAEETDEVNWLTSCGSMHDSDLPEAYLRVEPDDPTSGQLVVVRRDLGGGVAWRVWSIRAE